eukprot:scaffold1706_cov116-Cylindrotheca_fusiformis.AAC.14
MVLLHPAPLTIRSTLLGSPSRSVDNNTHQRTPNAERFSDMGSGDAPSSTMDGVSSIVGSGITGFEIPPQQDLPDSRSRGTRSTAEFGEHSHPSTDTKPSSITQPLSTTATDINNSDPTTLSHLSTRASDQSYRASQTNTIQSEERNQENHKEKDSRALGNTPEANYAISNIPIASHSLATSAPQLHTATAAEIALGEPSSFTFQPSNQQAMGTTTRTSNQHWTTVQGDPKQEHIVENLPDVKEREEQEDTSRTSDTGAVSSPGRSTPMQHDSSDHEPAEHSRNIIGTPSTVSTAPSTDDASLATDCKLDDTLLPFLLHPGHTRNHSGSSWGEEGLLPGGLPMPRPNQAERSNPWMQPNQSQSPKTWGPSPRTQHVASFRNQQPSPWSQQPPQQHFQGDQYTQYVQQQQHRGRPIGMEIRQPRGYQPNRNAGPYQQQQNRQGFHPIHQPSGPHTPPRGVRGQRPGGTPISSNTAASGPSHAANQHQVASNPQRSSAEILKTLLRKKACLFEPDTSRAVALVTWLVGRELAIEYGFFSRQQLQSGVHACVASKIESGIITRTKVNRCMQIILNSCFHYIIPRADGTEEKGDYFRGGFAQSVQDDSFKLQYLSRLWNDVTVDRGTVLKASLQEMEEKPVKVSKSPTTPKSSPRLSSTQAPKSPKDSSDHDHYESKRAVLLCFNENVRSAEDVFRCHNEFIRDTANAAHLQLTAQEWRTFFGREAGNGRYLLGQVGIPMSTQDGPVGQDLLGSMSPEEAAKFRTSWCSKRYDHDHDLCGFSHVEINGGWLRRNPMVHPYKEEMCSFVSKVRDQRLGTFVVNECPLGVKCDRAHSAEELMYHPNCYKSKVCASVYSHSTNCPMGDVCPDFHPHESTRPPKKPSEKQFGARHAKKNEQPASVKASATPPMGAPVVYASPAPFSSFEGQLLMPGLQNLYRRHSSVVRAHLRTSGKCACSYSCFGDDLGITARPKPQPESRVGLPSVVRDSRKI